MRSVLLFLILLPVLQGKLYAQPIIAADVFAVAGHMASSADVSITSTLGEGFIFGGALPDLYACQGFQSGASLITTSTLHVGEAVMHLQYYPNPTSEGVTLQWEEPGQYAFELRNTLGQLIKVSDSKYTTTQHYFHLQDIPEGPYGIFIQNNRTPSVFVGWLMFQKQ